MIHSESESVCDLCKENTASAHIARVVMGRTIRQHLCEACAEQQYTPASSCEKEPEEEEEEEETPLESDSVSASSPASEVAVEAPAEDADGPERCPLCRTTWERLEENERTGCAQCYTAFENEILEVVTELQPSLQHVGKMPQQAIRRRRRLEDLRTKQVHRMEMLQRRLEEAVSAENYEEAAELRDKLREIESALFFPEN